MGVDWHKQMDEYRHYGIDTAMHFPIAQNDENYRVRVFSASQYLNDLLNNKNKKVFIHCTSGIVRSPTVVLAYHCLYKRTEHWKNVHLSRNSIVESVNDSNPNVDIVEKIIQDNYEFQQNQIDINSQKDIRRKEIIMKFDQKSRILRELAQEKEQRNIAEMERQRYL